MMTRGNIALLVLTVGLAAIGTALVIFGASYTVTSCNMNGSVYTMPAGSVFRGVYPIWSSPVQNTRPVCGIWTPPPTSVNYTVNYTLNYLGIAVLIIAAALWVLGNRRGSTQRKIVEGTEIPKIKS